MIKYARIFTLVSAFLIVFTFQNSKISAANQDDKLNLDWLNEDIRGVVRLLRLMPIEKQNIDTLKKSLKHHWSIDDDELGFGANRIRFSKGYGYCGMYVDVLVFKGRVAYYKIGVDGSSEKWAMIRNQILARWEKSQGPPISERESHIFYEKKFDSIFHSYFTEVAEHLGELQLVEIPADLKESYEYLISSMDISCIGATEGDVAIDALLEAKRVDLLENILRGYNPGGRIYAVLALQKIKQQGLELSAYTLQTMKKVSALPIHVSLCSGCIVNTGLTAKDVIRIYKMENR